MNKRRLDDELTTSNQQHVMLRCQTFFQTQLIEAVVNFRKQEKYKSISQKKRINSLHAQHPRPVGLKVSTALKKDEALKSVQWFM